jgi:hypothetical protein
VPALGRSFFQEKELFIQCYCESLLTIKRQKTELVLVLSGFLALKFFGVSSYDKLCLPRDLICRSRVHTSMKAKAQS